MGTTHSANATAADASAAALAEALRAVSPAHVHAELGTQPLTGISETVLPESTLSQDVERFRSSASYRNAELRAACARHVRRMGRNLPPEADIHAAAVAYATAEIRRSNEPTHRLSAVYVSAYNRRRLEIELGAVTL